MKFFVSVNFIKFLYKLFQDNNQFHTYFYNYFMQQTVINCLSLLHKHATSSFLSFSPFIPSCIELLIVLKMCIKLVLILEYFVSLSIHVDNNMARWTYQCKKVMPLVLELQYNTKYRWISTCIGPKTLYMSSPCPTKAIEC